MSAEAAYQLSIVYHEGHIVAKDIKKALHWLEISTLQGSEKAVSSCGPIFTSLVQAMPNELTTLSLAKIRGAAESELIGSLKAQLSNTMASLDSTVALRQWSKNDMKVYETYIASTGFSHLQAVCFQVASLGALSSKPEDHNTLDSNLLDGYNIFHGSFQSSSKEDFVGLVHQYGLVEKVDTCGLTMLQIAASKGDMELAEVLVEELGAKIDATGANQGMTPLWISCFYGHVNMASYLVDRGADARCRDKGYRRTILHFLNRCRDLESIATLADIGRQAGISIEETDRDGNSPLLSTFIGWDFSRGLAARWLIQQGANVFAKSRQNWSCLAATVRCLDVGLMKTILEAMQTTSPKSGDYTGRDCDLSSADAKKEAFETLFLMSDFHIRRFHGQSAAAALNDVVDMLLNADVMDRYKSSEMNSGINPLIAACFTGRDDLANAVLRATYCPDVNEVQSHGMTALHWAVEHGRTQTALELLRRGADPLLADGEGLNAFHRSSRFSPALLVEILDCMEAGHIFINSGLSTRDILGLSTTSDETISQSVFSILVIEGSSKHLEVAELLRTRYSLSHDSLSVKSPKETGRMTLTAFMILGAVSSNLFTPRQVDYLLNLSPRPSFVADTEGATLLHYAIRNFQYGKRCQDISLPIVNYC